MRPCLLFLCCILGACATSSERTLSADSSPIFQTSAEPSRLSIETRNVGIYLSPCADKVCGTVVIGAGAQFRFTHPNGSVTDLLHRPKGSLTIDATDREIDLSPNSDSASSGWTLQSKRARSGKRQNFIVRLEQPLQDNLVLQLPDVELDGKPTHLPPITIKFASK